MARTWPPAHPRTWPEPAEDSGTLLALIGDTHYGNFTIPRRSQMLADYIAGPVPDLFVHVGDVTESGISAENTAAKSEIDLLPADWIAVAGNHDVMGQSASAFATAMGMPGKDFTYDVGDIRLVCLAVDAEQTNLTLSAAQLAYLDAQLAAADRDCYVVHHVPLKDTVVGDTSVVYSSAQDHFRVWPDPETRAILNSRTRAKAWISGHTHSPTTVSGFLKAENVGSRTVACINASSPHYTGLDPTYSDPIRALYLNCYPDRIEVRPRNLGGHAWDAIGGNRVTTLSLS